MMPGLTGLVTRGWSEYSILAAAIISGFVMGMVVCKILDRRLIRKMSKELNELRWLHQQAEFLMTTQTRLSWHGIQTTPHTPDQSPEPEPPTGIQEEINPSIHSPTPESHRTEMGSAEEVMGMGFAWACGVSVGPRTPAGVGIVIKDSRGAILTRVGKQLGMVDRQKAMEECVAEVLIHAQRCNLKRLVLFISPLGPWNLTEKDSYPLNDHLKLLKQRVQHLSERFDHFELIVVDADKNKDAERLALKAIYTSLHKKWRPRREMKSG